MSAHLTDAPLENASLAARVAVTEPGQITWSVLGSNDRCANCEKYQDNIKKKGKQKGFGRCSLVIAHTRKEGALFNGKYAIACPKFEPTT